MRYEIIHTSVSARLVTYQRDEYDEKQRRAGDMRADAAFQDRDDEERTQFPI
jgi:hypothetical protein